LATDAAGLVGLLADGDRRRVFAALILGATTTADIKTATGLSTRAVVVALSRLVDGELVVAMGQQHYVVEETFTVAARAVADATPAESIDAEPEAAKVLRAFIRDGKLTSIPTQHSKRLLILDRLAQEFAPGRRYREREVNAILRDWHPDVAALRRYLVDDSFLDREAGEYWRSGGSFPVS
jgi:hypothetical protein